MGNEDIAVVAGQSLGQKQTDANCLSVFYVKNKYECLSDLCETNGNDCNHDNLHMTTNSTYGNYFNIKPTYKEFGFDLGMKNAQYHQSTNESNINDNCSLSDMYTNNGSKKQDNLKCLYLNKEQWHCLKSIDFQSNIVDVVVLGSMNIQEEAHIRNIFSSYNTYLFLSIQISYDRMFSLIMYSPF